MYSDLLALSPRQQTVNGFRVVKNSKLNFRVSGWPYMFDFDAFWHGSLFESTGDARACHPVTRHRIPVFVGAFIWFYASLFPISWSFTLKCCCILHDGGVSPRPPQKFKIDENVITPFGCKNSGICILHLHVTPTSLKAVKLNRGRTGHDDMWYFEKPSFLGCILRSSLTKTNPVASSYSFY